jgi:hypothetical protein
VVNATFRPLYDRERDPLKIVQEDGWAPEAVRMDTENLTFTGIRFPDRPARSHAVGLQLLSHTKFTITW